MREAILTLILCLNLSNNVYAQPIEEEVTSPENTITVEQEVQNKIDSLDKSDLEQWFIQYQQIQSEYSDRLDPDESIHDVISDKEFNFICQIVEKEIGNGTFSQKINVSDVIMNRYHSSDFPDTFTGILKQKIGNAYQFTTYATGVYKNAKITQSTKLAVEYSYSMPDITDGATYFHSGYSGWHKRRLNYLFTDGKHYFYKAK